MITTIIICHHEQNMVGPRDQCGPHKLGGWASESASSAGARHLQSKAPPEDALKAFLSLPPLRHVLAGDEERSAAGMVTS